MSRVLLVVLALIACSSPTIVSAEPPLPAAMSRLEYLELENAEMKYNALREKHDRALAEEGAPMLKTKQATMAKYKMGSADRVAPDGTITRAPKPVAAKPAALAAPAAKPGVESKPTTKPEDAKK